MTTPLQKFETNRLLSIPDFANLLSSEPEEIERETGLLEYTYGSKGRKLINLHNVRTMKFMINWITKRLLYSFPHESPELIQYMQLLETLKERVYKVESLNDRIFSAPRRRYENF